MIAFVIFVALVAFVVCIGSFDFVALFKRKNAFFKNKGVPYPNSLNTTILNRYVV